MTLRLFRHYTELPADVQGGVVALGNFDGVHLGHQAVIGTARTIAQAAALPVGVMTFEPHPRTVFAKSEEAFRLTPFRIKARILETLGMDFLIAQHFDLAFARHTATEFVDHVLVEGMGVRHVVVGYDYLFGQNRGGDVSTLETMGRSCGFAVTVVPPVCNADGRIHSSTGVRTCLMEGRPREAALLLGRCFEVEGRVEHGTERGRRLGYPTANLHLGEYQPPHTGVYAVRAGVDRGGDTLWHDGVANYGRRPSFDNGPPLLEVHLFDFADDLYHRHLRVALVEFLRPERRFNSFEALQTQIAADSAHARAVLRPFAASADRPAPMVPNPTAPS
ncbi:MAG: riboflavin kinase / FMN adenylyltransferase [Rhodospirillaceae bacterium]|nr:MAG: riboflavin kinase / FMN adenylyltransferase [Rhodospirillaceae bacterium]